MLNNPLLFPAIAAAAVFILYMLFMRSTAQKETTRERMERIVSATADKQEIDKQMDVDPLRLNYGYSPLGTFCYQLLHLLGFDIDSFRKTSQLRFYRAGISSPDAPAFYLCFKYFGRTILLVAVFSWVFFSHAEGTQKLMHWMMALFLAVIGFSGADMYINNKRAKREKKLLRSFPDALDLLLVCVESGLALDGALARVCKELGHAFPDITIELNRTRMELTLLNDRAQALSNLAERTDMVAFRTLVTTLLQSERFGTGLTDTLRVLSEDYRNTRLMLAENAAGRLPALMTIPMMLFMLPALFIIILAPAAISTLSTIHNM